MTPSIDETLYEDGGLQGMSFRAIAKGHGCSYSMPSYFDCLFAARRSLARQ